MKINKLGRKEGFRKSSEYEEWKKRLHHYYELFPIVEHFQNVDLDRI
ncbi:hypothetical protein [Bacillus sp. 123MFChir2]